MIFKKFQGWFATSFWVDCHYALATLGTLVVVVVFAAAHTFNTGFAAFVATMWVTAIGNDKVNMPDIPSVP